MVSKGQQQQQVLNYFQLKNVVNKNEEEVPDRNKDES